MKNFKSLLIATVVALGFFETQAQVQFKVERMGETNNFMVYAVSTETYSNPQNLVSTAQVTMLANTGSFELDKIVSLYPNAKWRVNGRTNAPKENPSQDYIYFGLENLGTSALKFEKGKDIPLFLIQAKTCESHVSLMDNTKDPFMFPNSQHINVGNQITILGAGGDAFKGNIKGSNSADCLKSKSSTLDPQKVRVIPNITSPGVVKIEFYKNDKDNDKGDLNIYDQAGRVVFAQTLEAKRAYNSVEADLSALTNGIYYVMVSGIKVTPMVERLIISE
jgi:Secretion system C-terminal sorting domain